MGRALGQPASVGGPGVLLKQYVGQGEGDMEKDTAEARKANEHYPYYPECVVQLLGTDGNAVLMFRKVRRGLERYLRDVEGKSVEEAQAEGKVFEEEATSGDYDNVGITCQRWVTIT